MNSVIIRTTLREIKESLGRYMAILAIIALGVALFVGLKVAKPAMQLTGSEYMEDHNLYDLRLISTMGFCEDEVRAVREMPGVRSAEGAVYMDVLALESSGIENVLRMHSLQWEQNQVELKAGRMPVAPNECLLDAGVYGTDMIGTTLRISSANKEETLDMIEYEEYRVVGLCDSVLYVNFERGSTALGNGQLKGFAYIPEEGFEDGFYTDIYVRLEEQFELYSDEYKEYIDDALQWAEPLGEELCLSHYQTLKEDAEWQIADGERILAEQKAEAEEEFADARQELTDAEADIAEAEAEIADGWEEIREAYRDLEEGRADLAEGRAELEDGRAEIADGLKELEDMRAEAAELTDEDERKMMEGGLNLGEAFVKGKQAQVEAGLGQVNMGEKQLESALEILAIQEKKLQDAELELADGKEELADGWKEYEEQYQEFEEKIADAETDLTEAKADLAELEEPDCYVFGRDKNVGYVCFENDSNIVNGIANVFPVFFFLVAALVCITTMARMVEEQRTQIGVLKALGYSEGTIMGKLLFYSGSAALIGCAIGFAVGSSLFPSVIWFAYGIMYRMKSLHIIFDWKLGVISLAVALLCSMGTTMITCRYELMSVAAQLMRPKAPKNGKRIILEYIPVLWKRMPFLAKVSARNIFRYKQRFFMMVFGVGGCTALLITGFGVKDSIAGVINMQFGEVQFNDLNVVFQDALSTIDHTEFDAAAAENVEEYAVVLELSVDVTGPEMIKNANLIIPEKPEEITNYLSLHDAKWVKIPFPGKDEVVLSNKLADHCGLEIGDTAEIQDEDMNTLTLTVTGICENYVDSFAYTAPESWTGQIGKEPEYKSAYLNIKEGKDSYAVAAAMMNCEGVASASAHDDMKLRFENMISSMDYVVLLIIACAAALAFIVLYNLTNINITERLREIATIKVLGFYRKETGSYVFRENQILTGLGAAVGLVMGKYFHAFVMDQIDVDMVTFDVRIEPVSVLYSIVLTFVFSTAVNRIMNRKLDAINMAESMKSIE